MPIVKFFGLVLPPAIEVSFDGIPRSLWDAEEVGLKMHFSVNIVKSVVEVACEVNRFQPDDLSHIWMRSFDLARAAVDVLAFALGVGLTVWLHTFVDDQGVSGPISLNHPDLSSLCNSYKVNSQDQEERLNLEKILTLVITEPPLFMALNDLISSINLPHQAPINCGRVVDGLKKLVTDEKDPVKSWVTFRDTLRADEAFVKLITERSKNPRHGNRSFMPGAATREVMNRTWQLMDRFLEYRKGGNVPLGTNFPILLG